MPGIRRFTILVAAAGLLGGLALPAVAKSEPVQKKSVTGVDGRAATVTRYAGRGEGRPSNSVTMTATDTDGRGGRCTEAWVDYSTKPHQHFNPGLFVNCAGGTRGVSGAVTNDYEGVVGMAVVVCEVPDTSGSIARNERNCRGPLSAFDLHSGERYDDYRVEAPQYPSGVRIWRR
jgi:hypothetical protein